MEGQTTQWPSERRVNGRTDHTMAVRKRDRQHKPSEKREKDKNNGLQNNKQKT
jgi:hypothetical protein